MGRVLGPALLGLAAAVVVIGVATYRGLWFPAPWSFSFPGLGSSRLAHWQASGLYYGALVVLGLAWMWLLEVVRARPRFPVVVVLAVFVLWSVPFVVGPSVSSEDVYAYAGLGRLVERGLDPYQVGLNALGPEPVVAVSPPFWRDNPSPYGPLYVRVAWLASVAAHDSVRVTVVALRLFGLACLLLLALPLSALARRAGTMPAVAVAAVLCSPIVLLELVGAAHNEPLMLVLLAAGVAVGLAGLDRLPRTGPRPLSWDRGAGLVAAGVVLCGAAASVKLPGLLGAVLLGWLWAGPAPRSEGRSGPAPLSEGRSGPAPRSEGRSGPGATVVRRLPGLVTATGLALAVIAAISVASGLGFGWIAALDEPQRAYTVLAPFTAFALVAQQVLLHLGLPTGWVLPVLRPLGTLLGIAVAGLLITRAERLGAPLALGLALLVLAATTPVVWPWYMVWGFVFVATVAVPRALQVAVVALNLALTPLGPGSLDVTGRPTFSALLVSGVVLAGGVWAVTRLFRPPVPDVAVAGGPPAGPRPTQRTER